MELVRSLGADHVIDYTQEDFTQNGHRYDLIIDAAAYRPIADNERVLSAAGIYVMVGGATARLLQVMLRSMTGNKKVATFIKKTNQKDLVVLKELLEAGKVVPAIDKRYPLGEAAEAIRYLEQGHARGKVVITVN